MAGPEPTGLGYGRPVSAHTLVRLTDAGAVNGAAPIAEEVPVAFVYNGRSHAVMMSTPADLEDLAVGFTLTEEIVERASDIAKVEVVRYSKGIELQIDVPEHAARRLAERARALAGRTGCGLCGVEAIGDAVRAPRLVGGPRVLDPEALWRAGAELVDHQPMNRDTNAVHAAGWASSDGSLGIVREDVGRHNALDKVVGALARAGRDPRAGFIVVTSRASFELVQKATVAGVSLLAAVSRPTALAVRLAETSGLTLVGLLRGRTANIYAHPERLRAHVPPSQPTLHAGD
jgi:FdhD protein